MSSLDRLHLKPPYIYRSIAIVILIIIHLVGLAGLNMAVTQHFFEGLAKYNLILSFFAVFSFHKSVHKSLLVCCSMVFVIGMIAEIIGVNTGYPFGSYYYTESFGPQFLGVPLVIGVNWVLLGYSVAVATNQYLNQTWIKILAAALLMVFIDVLLENFAVRHHFWVWQNGWPPLQNYVAWFVVSCIIQVAFRKTIPKAHNEIAIPYLIILIAFLAADLIISLK